MKNCLIYLISFAFCIGFATAQTKYSTDSKRAIKLYEEAREHFSKRKFEDGVENLLKAIEIDDKFVEAHFQLANTYELFRDHKEAVKYFKKTTELAPDNVRYRDAYYQLSVDYLDKGEYQNAQTAGEKYLSLNPNFPKFVQRIQKIIIDCKFSIENIKKPLDFNSTALPKPINQLYLQYFPILTGDQQSLIFTGRKNPAKLNLESDENLYESKWENGKWSDPISISANINGIANEGTASISADGKTLVFTSCDQASRPNFGQCDLYISTKTGNEWSKPVNLGATVNSNNWESQPSLSADGKTLYFISSKAGGKGLTDIWISKKGEDGKWQEATPLAALNTPDAEVSPFIHPNGKTLFFASKGYAGFGNYDLYKSELINGKWTTPQNLGYPINNHNDQVALFITTDGNKGYYSVEQTSRGEITSSILHVFDVPQEIRPKQKSNYVKGNVYDSKTKAKLDAKIDLFNLTDNAKQASVNSDAKDGSYLIVLSEGSEYALEVNRKGYAFKSLTFNYVESADIKPLEIDIPLDPIAKGTVFRLNNIFFDYNQFDLKEKSKTELDELVKFMKENEAVRGEISGHTDNIGVAQANQTLSLNRAKAVYEYLIKAGVDAKRLTFKGYGASKPDATNDTEEGRAKNRRIEFEIL